MEPRATLDPVVGGRFQSLLKIGEWKTLDDGAKLTTAGEAVQNVYVVVRGTVTAETKDGPVALPAGKYVGEVSLLKVYSDATKKDEKATPAPQPLASATCKADGETQVFVWSQESLLDFLKSDPASAKVIRTIFSDVLEKFHTTN